MDTKELKTVALRAAVDGAARDSNIMEAAQRYYEWLSAPEVVEAPVAKASKKESSK